jgi:DNA-directed RNA polymerase subunit RPC12/RpoP
MRRDRRGLGRVPPLALTGRTHRLSNQACESCGNKIERRILRRILRARRRGLVVPMLCRSCFLKQSQESPAITGNTKAEQGKTADLDVSEWTCIRCNALLEPEEVAAIRDGKTVECEYCGSVLSRELF